jgi:hypothetical protein
MVRADTGGLAFADHGLPDLVQKTFRARTLAADDEGHPRMAFVPEPIPTYADIVGQ